MRKSYNEQPDEKISKVINLQGTAKLCNRVSQFAFQIIKKLKTDHV